MTRSIGADVALGDAERGHDRRGHQVGREDGASGTKNTPSGNWSMTSAATWSARRVLPVPPGPVSVSRRVVAEQLLRLGDQRLAADEARQLERQVVGRGVERARAREVVAEALDDELEEALRAREVLQAVLAEIPDRGARQGADPRRARGSPTTRGPGRRARPRRSARRGGPRGRRSRRRSTVTSPVWTPIRTGTLTSGGQPAAASARWASAAARSPPLGLGNAAKNESPSVPTSVPPPAAIAARIRRRCVLEHCPRTRGRAAGAGASSPRCR